MELKKIMTVAAILGATTFGATSASALQAALTAAETHYGITLSQSCNACHANGNGSTNVLTQAWLSNGGTKTSGPTNWTAFDSGDADSDGITNRAEFEAGTSGYVNPNAATTPSSTGGGGGGGGCMTSAATTPLMMLVALLTLGFFIRRKKD